MIQNTQHRTPATQVAQDTYRYEAEFLAFPSDESNGRPSQQDAEDTARKLVEDGIPGLPQGEYDVRIDRVELIVDPALGPLIILVIILILTSRL